MITGKVPTREMSCPRLLLTACMQSHNECLIENMSFCFSFTDAQDDNFPRPLTSLWNPALALFQPSPNFKPVFGSISTSYSPHTACGLRVRLRTLDCGRVELSTQMKMLVFGGKVSRLKPRLGRRAASRFVVDSVR
jgi:hypothetical protein